MTTELHIIPSSTLQTNKQPSSLQISKYFLRSQVEDIKNEFNSVQVLGDAAAEEWVKGLDSLGKQRRNDAAKWERWAASGGLLKMRENSPADDKLAGSFISTVSQVNYNLEQIHVPTHIPAFVTKSSIYNLRYCPLSYAGLICSAVGGLLIRF